VPATRVLEFEAHPFEAGLRRMIHPRTLGSSVAARCSQVHNVRRPTLAFLFI
jgi:hypothetical protein